MENFEENRDKILEHLESCHEKVITDGNTRKNKYIAELNRIQATKIKMDSQIENIELYVAERLIKLFGEDIQEINVIVTDFGSFAIGINGNFISGSLHAYKKWAYSGVEAKKEGYKLNWKKVIIVFGSSLAALGLGLELSKLIINKSVSQWEILTLPELPESRTGLYPPCDMDQPLNPYVCSRQYEEQKVRYQRILKENNIKRERK
jgi:hypothetical protein